MLLRLQLAKKKPAKPRVKSSGACSLYRKVKSTVHGPEVWYVIQLSTWRCGVGLWCRVARLPASSTTSVVGWSLGSVPVAPTVLGSPACGMGAMNSNCRHPYNQPESEQCDTKSTLSSHVHPADIREEERPAVVHRREVPHAVVSGQMLAPLPL